ncbi:uncharacterized protein LOC122041060 [Zingiber officinale]|uniref:Pollen Ole e 1 allergen and extensin family protein n=1 Tax=Zingiber officinale TaxID=94328 RepID=A0A8J5HNP4_ZINOF|nr:uncharacterized protein LOC122041060 [Zingiber officinale]KAG6527708.1 hypothetical protein ZIOFF_009834 [Zingiber officinale]
MNPAAISLVIFLFSISAVARLQPHRVSNITVLGSVYCDACSDNSFSKNSYFLRGAQVVVQCKFAVVNSTSQEEMSITAYRTTDRFGVYKLDIPPVDGLECHEGREVKSMCRAILVRSSSARCNTTGFTRSSTAHVAFKDRETGACYYNLNALSYKPVRSKCSKGREAPAEGSGPTLGSSLSFIFWPIFPPVGIPWPISLPFPFPPLPFLLPPSLPFPFPHFPWPDPASLPFTIPSWLLPFLKPPFFPFPFPAPNPPPVLLSEP